MKRALQTLLALPAVFDYRQVAIALDLNDQAAIQQCYRWKNNGFIKSTGDKTGVFYNLLVDKDHERHLMEAVLKTVHRQMVIIGPMALNDAGWTSQMPKIYDIAVPGTRSAKLYPKIDGVQLHPRPVTWFQAVWPVAQEYEGNTLRMAPPEYALVDSIRSGRVHGPNTATVWLAPPSDITPDGDEADVIARCYRAAQALKVSVPAVHDYLAKVPDLEDHLDLVDIDEVLNAAEASTALTP